MVALPPGLRAWPPALVSRRAVCFSVGGTGFTAACVRLRAGWPARVTGLSAKGYRSAAQFSQRLAESDQSSPDSRGELSAFALRYSGADAKADCQVSSRSVYE